MNRCIVDEWDSCYSRGWLGELVPAAYAHPAKISFKLAERIYAHAIEQGCLVPGQSTVVDPFGGICGLGFHAALNGIRFVAVELEPRFVALGNQNIDLWQRKYSSLKGWTRPVLVQGDSRNLSSVVASAGCVVSSPPFHQSGVTDHKGQTDALIGKFKGGGDKFLSNYSYGDTPGQLATMVCGSPPFYGVTGNLVKEAKFFDHPAQKNTANYATAKTRGIDDYGTSPGQLSAMPEGKVSSVISSPPFSDCERGGTGVYKHPDGCGCNWCRKNRGNAGATQGGKWGASADGNLGTMPEGNAAAACVVSSPPFEDQEPSHAQGTGFQPAHDGNRRFVDSEYGKTAGNIGNSTGDTFWSAAAEIVAQCRMILRPGGHAIWVTKRFVRNKAIVEFSDQWQALCESHGFRLVCRHKAMLVAHHGEQDTIFGDTQAMTTERKSFFRRLAEKKGSPRIDFEDVLCFQLAEQRTAQQGLTLV